MKEDGGESGVKDTRFKKQDSIFHLATSKRAKANTLNLN